MKQFYEFIFNIISEIFAGNFQCHVITIIFLLLLIFLGYYFIKSILDIAKLKKINKELKRNVDKEIIKLLNKKENENNSSS